MRWPSSRPEGSRSSGSVRIPRGGSMADRPTVGILGLGHIGGSLALAIPGCVAWTRSPDTPEAAAAAGVDGRAPPAEGGDAGDNAGLAPPLPALADALGQ